MSLQARKVESLLCWVHDILYELCLAWPYPAVIYLTPRVKKASIAVETIPNFSISLRAHKFLQIYSSVFYTSLHTFQFPKSIVRTLLHQFHNYQPYSTVYYWPTRSVYNPSTIHCQFTFTSSSNYSNTIIHIRFQSRTQRFRPRHTHDSPSSIFTTHLTYTHTSAPSTFPPRTSFLPISAKPKTCFFSPTVYSQSTPGLDFHFSARSFRKLARSPNKYRNGARIGSSLRTWPRRSPFRHSGIELHQPALWKCEAERHARCLLAKFSFSLQSLGNLAARSAAHGPSRATPDYAPHDVSPESEPLAKSRASTGCHRRCYFFFFFFIGETEKRERAKDEYTRMGH